MKCGASECPNGAVCKGYCDKHYRRWKRHGSPEIQGREVDPERKRAWIEEAATATDDECREWPWTRIAQGYGHITWEGRTRKVGQVVLEVSGQPRPSGAMTLHSCDNPPCANVQHLRWGDALENAADAVDRGQQHRGTRCHNARLTDADALDILRAKADGESQYSIAKRYGVAQTTISKLIRGDSWTHLERTA